MEDIITKLAECEYYFKNERYNTNSQERYELIHEIYEEISNVRLKIMGLI